jgi:uncharacterized protein (TIGR03437 family)
VAPYQLLTIFGTGLGPATGVSATNNTTGALAGVDVSFGSTPAPLLYVSSTQINFAVPADLRSSVIAPMQMTVNGVSSVPLALPLTYANPSLFLNFPEIAQAGQSGNSGIDLLALALNADSSVNSSANPAPLGSVISVFVNGMAQNPDVNSEPPQLSSDNGWTVTSISQATPFVLQVDLQVPSKLVANLSCTPNQSLCTAIFDIYNVSGGAASPQSMLVSGQEFGAAVYLTRPQ